MPIVDFDLDADQQEAFSRCFSDADSVIVAPLYTAGEPPIDGIDSHALARGIRDTGHRSVQSVAAPGDLVPLVKSSCQPGDTVVFLGAGNITQWAYALPEQLAAEPHIR